MSARSPRGFRSRPAWSALALLVAALAAPTAPMPARAQGLAQLLPEEADVFVSQPGLARLPLPAEVLTACAPGLSDLRLFDRAGNEVPYLLDPGVAPGGERRENRAAAAPVIDLVREEIPREGRKPLTREVYRVAYPASPPAGESWTLLVGSRHPRFVRSVEVSGVERDGTAVALVPRASLFRLGQPLADRTAIPLPRFDGTEIAVAIEGEDGFFLEPTLAFASERTVPGLETLAIPLALRERASAGGRSALEVDRPPGLLPSRLRVATATPVLDREVAVWDVDASGAAVLVGRGRIVRAPGTGGAPAIERLDVEIGRVRGTRLRLEVIDGDSPPLADLAVSAQVSRPAIVFALPFASAAEPAGVLRFGGDRAWAPRYDLADLFRDAIAAAPDAVRLADPTALPEARLGPIRANPAFDPRPALAAATHPGAAIDRRQWRWARPFSVPGSPEGLVRLRLAPDDAAYAEDRFADLRVVDGAGRQWPYLLAPPVERARVALALDGPVRAGGESRWRLRVPRGALTLDHLVVAPARPVLDRPYRIERRDDAGATVLVARGTLRQALRRSEPVAVHFPAVRVEEIELVVEDGDDAPIDLTGVESAIALPEVLIAAPSGAYELLAGNPDAAAPRYELDRAREVVLDLRSVPAAAGEGAEVAGWDGVPGGRARAQARLERTLVWGSIALAVVVLIALTLRIARGRPHAG